MSPQDDKLVEELGLGGLSEEQQALRVQQFYATLQLKIVMALEDKLSEAQLEEFKKVRAQGDDATTAAWLKQAIPDYDKIGDEEMDALKTDIMQTGDRLKQAIDQADD